MRSFPHTQGFPAFPDCRLIACITPAVAPRSFGSVAFPNPPRARREGKYGEAAGAGDGILFFQQA
jgi:hypothetical protein